MINSKSLPSDGNMVWSITTDPTVEPITVDELKLFGRIDGSDEDTLLSNFITAARIAAEEYLGRALLEQTITLKMDYWPEENEVELPRPPLISITSISELDEDDTATTYSSNNYYIITESIPGKVIIKYGSTPPDAISNNSRQKGGIQIIYKAGYGSNATDVPQSIREGVKLWAMDIYENRVVREEPPPEARTFFDIYRVIYI